MDPEVFLPPLQEPATDVYSEADESNPQIQFVFL